jgi:hypothetical protein
MKKTLFATFMVALLAALPAAAQVNMTNYVALGDSLTMGVASAGMMDFYQERSYPGVLAQQAGTPDFQMPLISPPGMPPLWELQALFPNTILGPTTDVPGMPYNAELPRPYNNLGISGATVYDLFSTTGDIQNLLRGNTDNVPFDIVLRFPTFPGTDIPAPAVAQAIGLEPTFVTMWIGNNDILGAAYYATPVEGVTMTPVDLFTEYYQTVLGALATSTSADIVVFTLPNVTAIPFVTTTAPYLDVPGVGRVPLIGSNGLLPEDAYVTLGASSLLAQGIGIPVELGGTGEPLPEDLQIVGTEVYPGVVLRPEEVETISNRITAFNQVIRATAGALGAHVFDAGAVFRSISAEGAGPFGGIELSTDFLTGGIFSYDGIHPQNIGQAIVAMELIDFINAEFGADIPQVNMDQVLCLGGCADQGPPAGAPSKDAILSYEALLQLQHAFPLVGWPHPQYEVESHTD